MVKLGTVDIVLPIPEGMEVTRVSQSDGDPPEGTDCLYSEGKWCTTEEDAEETFEMVTFEDKCPKCSMVYGVTPCHAFDAANVKPAGINY